MVTPGLRSYPNPVPLPSSRPFAKLRPETADRCHRPCAGDRPVGGLQASTAPSGRRPRVSCPTIPCPLPRLISTSGLRCCLTRRRASSAHATWSSGRRSHAELALYHCQDRGLLSALFHVHDAHGHAASSFNCNCTRYRRSISVGVPFLFCFDFCCLVCF